MKIRSNNPRRGNWSTRSSARTSGWSSTTHGATHSSGRCIPWSSWKNTCRPTPRSKTTGSSSTWTTKQRSGTCRTACPSGVPHKKTASPNIWKTSKNGPINIKTMKSCHCNCSRATVSSVMDDRTSCSTCLITKPVASSIRWLMSSIS